MTVLYNLGIFFFHIGVLIASFFNRKARLLLIGQSRLIKNIESSITRDNDILWFHAASVGEFEQGRPVMEAIRQKYPHYKILLTFFSPSGYEAKKNYKGADYIFYLPFDYSWNARRFIRIIKPRAIFFIKYEFWLHYIKYAHKNQIPIYCISAIFRPGQVFFKWYGSWYRKILYKFSHLFVQNQLSEKLLHQIGISNVSITGDTRFDRVYQIASNAKQLPIIEAFSRNNKIIIAGSTWEPDEKLLVNYINKNNHNNLKFIIVPHEVDKPLKLQQLIKQINLKTICYTQATTDNVVDYQVLIIDIIGILSSAYKYGYIAYIGGGFGKGIHNILEAATYGIPVIFGPKYKKFNEAVELIRVGGGHSINNYARLEAIFEKLLNNNEYYNQCASISKEFVKSNLGATDKILTRLIL